MNRRVFISVSGGVVQEVIVPTQTDGTWTVIDWDNIESDPAREWGQFDVQAQKYIKDNYLNRYAFFLEPNASSIRILTSQLRKAPSC